MMLTRDKIISIFCLIDDILKGIDHKEDIRRQVSDSEIILTAIVSATSFYGNHYSSIQFMKQYGFTPNMLDKSRLNRRLHKVRELLYELFEMISSYFRIFVVSWIILLILFLLKYARTSESSVYGDSAYLDCGLEDRAFERLAVMLKILRKSNSKRIDTTEQKLEKL